MKWTNKGRQFEEYKDLFTQRNRILVVGSPLSQEYFLKNICPDYLKQVVDRTQDINSLVYNHDKKHIIVVVEFGDRGNDIVLRLTRAGYVRYHELYFYTDMFWTEIRELNNPFIPLFGFYALNEIYVSSTCIIPSTRCNLNCRDCLNFTPYLDKFESRNYDEVCEDVDVLFRWIDYSERFQLSGGEALLYPHLRELINYIGEKYRSQIGIYELVINGTIVPSDDLCRSFIENDMMIYLDNYIDTIPENLNKREEIISKFEKHGIRWVDNTVNDWFSLAPFETDNSLKNEEELVAYFDRCNNPWHNLENGKMYSCNFSRFAMKAGIISESENDSFDFRTMTEAKKPELLEFLLGYTDKGYVDFCKQCSGWGAHNKNRVPVAVQAESNKR
jgi:hypothetical protein